MAGNQLQTPECPEATVLPSFDVLHRQKWDLPSRHHVVQILRQLGCPGPGTLFQESPLTASGASGSIYGKLEEKRCSRFFGARPLPEDGSCEVQDRPERQRLLLDLDGKLALGERREGYQRFVSLRLHAGEDSRYGLEAGLEALWLGIPYLTARIWVWDTSTNSPPRCLGRACTRVNPHSPLISLEQARMASVRILEDQLIPWCNEVAGEFQMQDAASGAESQKPWAHWGLVKEWSFLLFRFLPAQLAAQWRNWRQYQGVQWNVGVRVPKSGGETLVWAQPGRRCFLADPIPWTREGRMDVFLEELPYTSRRGRISVLSYSADHGFGELKPVIEEDHHLSFPYLFEEGGELWMMPEQASSGETWAYRCRKYPEQWERSRLVFDRFPIVDGVLVKHEGRWWLFCSRSYEGFGQNNLYLFHSSSPWDPKEWVPHPMNPIRDHLRGARMAGGLFQKDPGSWIRPGQDCSGRYGGGVVLYEILKWTPEVYEEREMAVHEPSEFMAPWQHAIHTWSPSSGRVFIDGARPVYRKDIDA